MHNHAGRDAEILGDTFSLLGIGCTFETREYVHNIRGGQFTATSVFSVPIKNVLMIRAFEPMGWIATKLKIAFVKNVKRIGVFFMHDEPSDTARQMCFFVYCKLPLIGWCFRANPRPALIGVAFLDLLPELGNLFFC